MGARRRLFHVTVRKGKPDATSLYIALKATSPSEFDASWLDAVRLVAREKLPFNLNVVDLEGIECQLRNQFCSRYLCSFSEKALA